MCSLQLNQPKINTNTCLGCISHSCCKDEPAFLTTEDINRILESSKKTGKEIIEERFVITKTLGKTKMKFMRMKTIKQNNIKLKVCIFFDDNLSCCDIYNNRPLDCRIFPFDLIKEKEKYFWIKYLLPNCLPNFSLKNTKTEYFPLIKRSHKEWRKFANAWKEIYSIDKWQKLESVNL